MGSAQVAVNEPEALLGLKVEEVLDRQIPPLSAREIRALLRE
jgi:hypothetical protein